MLGNVEDVRMRDDKTYSCPDLQRLMVQGKIEVSKWAFILQHKNFYNRVKYRFL